MSSFEQQTGGLQAGAGSLPDAAPTVGPTPALIDQFHKVQDQLKDLSTQVDQLGNQIGGPLKGAHPTSLDIFNGYIGVFAVAFVITLILTPVMRRLAIANGIIDRPNEARKVHKVPIAYLGGVGVYLGIVGGIFFSYLAPIHGLLQFHAVKPEHLNEIGIPMPVSFWVLAGMTIIMLVGLLDDVVGVSPLRKVGGQLLAAAFLAMGDIGVKLAYQLLYPIGAWMGYGVQMAATNKWVLFALPLGGTNIEFDVVYWTGTAIIAIFVLGACNASNLIDGLDGLLSGVTAIATGGLLVVGLALAAADTGPLDASRSFCAWPCWGGAWASCPTTSTLR